MCRAQDDPFCPGGRRCHGLLSRERRSRQRTDRLLRALDTDELVEATAGAGIALGLALSDSDSAPAAARLAMAERGRRVTPAQAELLASDPSRRVRLALAQRGQWLGPKAEAALREDTDPDVRALALARTARPVSPPRYPRVTRAYAEDTPESDRVRAMDDGETRAYVSGLVRSGSPWPDDAVMVACAGHDDWHVRATAAEVVDTSPAVLKSLACDEIAFVRARAVQHSAFPRRSLRPAAADPSPLVRAAVASRATDTLLMDMASDPAPSVRASVARRLRPRVDMSAAFLRDPAPSVREGAATMYARSAEDLYTVPALTRAAKSGDPATLRALARNRDFHRLPERELQRLAVSVDQGTWIPAQAAITERDQAESNPSQKARQFHWLAGREKRLRALWPVRVEAEIAEYAAEQRALSHESQRQGWKSLVP